MDKVEGWLIPIVWVCLALAMVTNLVLAEPGVDFWTKASGFALLLLICLGIHNMGEAQQEPSRKRGKRGGAIRHNQGKS